MIYHVTNQFVPINETSGTIQNSGFIHDVEVSDKPEVNSGILLRPHDKISFSGTTLYMRCVDENSAVDIRVVPFFINAGTNSGGGSSTDDYTQDDAANDIINDAWNGNYTPDDNTQDIIDDMWNNPTDTGDDFSDYLDGLFAG